MEYGEVRLNQLEALIVECWLNAEQETAAQIALEHVRPPEELITGLFEGKLRRAVVTASHNGRVADAFLQDVRGGIPTLDIYGAQMFGGLTATVNFHNKQHEGRISGADLGIVISRPLVKFDSLVGRIETYPDQAIGLLAQAKLGRQIYQTNVHYDWDRLTNRQVALFQHRREYSSLLLYRADGDQHNQLRPFGWQHCGGYKASNAQLWLDTDSFPNEVSSVEIMQGLFERTLGVKDSAKIDRIIHPQSTADEAIELKISWPDGGGPPPASYLQVPSTNLSQRIRQ